MQLNEHITVQAVNTKSTLFTNNNGTATEGHLYWAQDTGEYYYGKSNGNLAGPIFIRPSGDAGNDLIKGSDDQPFVDVSASDITDTEGLVVTAGNTTDLQSLIDEIADAANHVPIAGIPDNQIVHGDTDNSLTSSSSLTFDGTTLVAPNLSLDSGTTSIGSSEINLLDGMTAKTGIDTNFATGTAGSTSEIAMWNTDGDLVGSGLQAGNVLTDITAENLGDLSNVSLTSVADGEVLKYNNTSGNWENQTDSTGGGGGGVTLTEVALTSGTNTINMNSASLVAICDIGTLSNGTNVRLDFTNEPSGDFLLTVHVIDPDATGNSMNFTLQFDGVNVTIYEKDGNTTFTNNNEWSSGGGYIMTVYPFGEGDYLTDV